MSSIWDVLKKTATVQGFSPQGINPVTIKAKTMVGKSPEPPKPSQFDLSSDEIQSIIQTSQKGFRVIDINPNLLTREQNFCVYNQGDLNLFLGSEMTGVAAGYNQVDGNNTGNFTTAAYWRTVELPVQGNFLKIEYLPTRLNTSDYVYQPANSLITPYYDAQNCSSAFQPYLGHKYASDRMILLDFEETTTNPLIVKSGTCFRGYFTRLFLTIKQLSPRIRITVGFNSEIREDFEKPRNLHLWNGHGLLENSYINPVPFCLSDRDDTTYTSGNGVPVAVGTDYEKNLITAQYADGVSKDGGIAIGWITGFTFLPFWSTVLGGSSVQNCFDAELFIYDNGTTTNVKRLASQSCFLNKIDPAMTMQSGHSGYTLSEPIRFTLKPNQSLRIRLSLCFGSVTISPRIKFGVQGYMLGGIRGSGGLNNAFPFINDFMLTENPYPLDFDYLSSPRR